MREGLLDAMQNPKTLTAALPLGAPGQDKQKTLLAEDVGHFSMIRWVPSLLACPSCCDLAPWLCAGSARGDSEERKRDVIVGVDMLMMGAWCRALHLADLITEMNGMCSSLFTPTGSVV